MDFMYIAIAVSWQCAVVSFQFLIEKFVSSFSFFSIKIAQKKTEEPVFLAYFSSFSLFGVFGYCPDFKYIFQYSLTFSNYFVFCFSNMLYWFFSPITILPTFDTLGLFVRFFSMRINVNSMKYNILRGVVNLKWENIFTRVHCTRVVHDSTTICFTLIHVALLSYMLKNK